MRGSFFMEGEQSSPNFQFPPGFRFHPSDEELIVYYLQNKATSRPLPASVIAEVDLYKYNPWELPTKALFGEDEWYFFSPRDRKYPNGERPNRAAGSGYWKATGTDKPIVSCYGSKKLGVKKALVFYTGRPPKGVKTDWMMNEYRLLDTTIKPSRLEGSMRLDDWVLCRVRLKSSIQTSACEIRDNHKAAAEETLRYSQKIEEARFTYTNQNTDMITDCLYKDCRLLASILANEALPPIETISSVSCQGSNNGNIFTSTYGDPYDEVNAPLTVSPLNAYFKPLKRKPSEENRSYENLLPTNPKPHGDNKLTFPNNDLNYASQYHESIYPNMSDPIIDFQGLNELAFASKYSH